MKTHLTRLAFLLVLFFGYATPQASAQSQMEMNQAAARDFDQADAQLNAVYKKLLSTCDAEGKKKLQAAQRAWITYRDAEAAWIADGERGGSIVPLIYSTAQTELTVARTKALRKLL